MSIICLYEAKKERRCLPNVMRIRTNSQLKENVEQVLSPLGMTMNGAINMAQ